MSMHIYRGKENGLYIHHFLGIQACTHGGLSACPLLPSGLITVNLNSPLALCWMIFNLVPINQFLTHTLIQLLTQLPQPGLVPDSTFNWTWHHHVASSAVPLFVSVKVDISYSCMSCWYSLTTHFMLVYVGPEVTINIIWQWIVLNVLCCLQMYLHTLVNVLLYLESLVKIK